MRTPTWLLVPYLFPRAASISAAADAVVERVDQRPAPFFYPLVTRLDCLLGYFTHAPIAEAGRHGVARLGGGESDRAGQAAIERQELGRCFVQKVAQLTEFGGDGGDLCKLRGRVSFLFRTRPSLGAPAVHTTTGLRNAPGLVARLKQLCPRCDMLCLQLIASAQRMRGHWQGPSASPLTTPNILRVVHRLTEPVVCLLSPLGRSATSRKEEHSWLPVSTLGIYRTRLPATS